MSENQNNLRQMSAADIPQTLPSFPSEDGSGSAVVVPDDIPQTLPSFPSVDGSGNPIPDTPQTLPSFPQPIPPSNNTPNQLPGKVFPCSRTGRGSQCECRFPEGSYQPCFR